MGFFKKKNKEVVEENKQPEVISVEKAQHGTKFVVKRNIDEISNYYFSFHQLITVKIIKVNFIFMILTLVTLLSCYVYLLARADSSLYLTSGDGKIVKLNYYSKPITNYKIQKYEGNDFINKTNKKD